MSLQRYFRYKPPNVTPHQQVSPVRDSPAYSIAHTVTPLLLKSTLTLWQQYHHLLFHNFYIKYLFCFVFICHLVTRKFLKIYTRQFYYVVILFYVISWRGLLKGFVSDTVQERHVLHRHASLLVVKHRSLFLQHKSSKLSRLTVSWG